MKLEEVDRLLTLGPANPTLLVTRAQLIRLQDAEAGSPTLDDAEADLRLAVKLDESPLVPLIESACFTHAVKDDARGASRLFSGCDSRV